MSRTSDAEVDALTSRAAAAGMAGPEIRGWRRALDPITLDACGCEASAKAAAVAGVIAAIVILVSVGVGLALLWALAVAFAAAVIGKVLGQRAAQRRRARLLGIFEERIQEVAATD